MTIHELIEKSGFSRRTIYYYTQLGLLPPPEGKGKNFRYTEEHLQRLNLIRRLQKARYSLKEIQQMLAQGVAAVRESFNEDEVSDSSVLYNRPPSAPRLPRQTLMRVQLAEGLELLVEWPLTPAARRYLERLLPNVLQTLEP